MDIQLALLFGLLGLAIGSFINALVWRLKTLKSLLKGRSMCPGCKHRLAPRDLVPLFSWLILRGKCRYCQAKISRQYPLVELLTGALFTLSFLAWDFTAGTIAAVEFGLWLLQLSVLIALLVYDYKWMLLPNKLVAVLAALAVLQLGVLALAGYPAQVWLFGPLAAALGAAGGFYLLFVVSRGAWMGGGDVKLVFVMGLLLGVQKTALALFLGFFLGALVGVALIAFKLKGRKDLIPFGPFLIGGLIGARLWGKPLLDWYLNLFSF